MIERWWASVTSAFVGVLIGALTMAGCATNKGPAQAAIAAAEAAVNSTLAEASKYVPDQAPEPAGGSDGGQGEVHQGRLRGGKHRGEGRRCVKAKAAEVMTTLGMPVPDALKG